MKLSRRGVLMDTRAKHMAQQCERILWALADTRRLEKQPIPDTTRLETLSNLCTKAENLIEQNLSMFRGNGFDIQIDLEKSCKSKGTVLYLKGDYHYMDEGGGYVGYAGFTVAVTASLAYSFTLDVKRSTGWTQAVERKYQLMEFISDSLYYWLQDEIDLQASRVDQYWNTQDEEENLQSHQ